MHVKIAFRVDKVSQKSNLIKYSSTLNKWKMKKKTQMWDFFLEEETKVRFWKSVHKKEKKTGRQKGSFGTCI